MKKINIAEMLHNYLEGMELDCVMYDNIVFAGIQDGIYPIKIKIKNTEKYLYLTKYGCSSENENAKCVIFPKGKTTWEGFVPPCKFKVGDVVISTSNNIHLISCHDKNYGGWESCCSIIYGKFDSTKTVHVIPTRLATEEEKEKLFQAIKDNGYHWNNETKTLEELPKFKDGDVVVAEDSESQLFLLKKYLNKDSSSHDGYCYFGWDFQNNTLFEKGNWRFDRLATKEEKEKLFQIIKDNGYRWDEKTKTLEKLSIFKVGDKIRRKNNTTIIKTIGHIYSDGYALYDGHLLYFKEQDEWELVPNKFDIATLKPFDQVLVRDFDDETWEINFFSRLLDNKHFKCLDLSYVQCIPYEGNEHLLGTTDSCDDYFKTWKDE